MSAEEGAAAWEQLPLGVQQHILLLTGSSWPRRVSKAWRDTYDAANDTWALGMTRCMTGSGHACSTASAGLDVTLTGFKAWCQEHPTHPFTPCRLRLRSVPDQNLQVAATAAATRVVMNSASLTSIE